VARSLTNSGADAEDLVQETLLRAFRSIDRFDGRHPRAWLLTIVRNAESNRHRRRPELLDDPDQLERHEGWGSIARSTEELVLDAQFDPVVQQAFERLPAKLRVVVELVDLDGLCYQEAADALGVPIGTVMSRLHRARRRIRDRVVDAGVTPRSAR